jgi:mono/diheme cytochrome c family protein
MRRRLSLDHNAARYLLLAIGCWLCTVTVSVDAQNKKTVWDKVYSEEQAAKGKAEYETHCEVCHQKDLTGRASGGEGAELVGRTFARKWEFQNLNQLFSEIKKRMPRDNPGTLSDEAYLNIVAYMLQVNKFPAGDPLSQDSASLGGILFTNKDGSAEASAAPEPLTTGTLVQVVGCLEPGTGGWVLTKATAPVRTESPDPSKGDQQAKLKEMAAGTNGFRLLGIYSPPESQKGHTIEAKGFLVKDPSGDRLNVVSITTLNPACQ